MNGLNRYATYAAWPPPLQLLTCLRTHSAAMEGQIASECRSRPGRVAGRLQLPQDYLTQLSLQKLVRLELETDHVQVHPTGENEGTQ